MSLSDLMQQMADAGAPVEAIILAVRALEAKDEEIETRRAGARERKRRQRERDKGVTVTGQSQTSHGTKEIPPDPQKKTSPLNGSPKGEPIPPSELKPEHVVEAWNAAAERIGLKTVRKFTPERQRKLATRIRQNSIDDFTEAIFAIERSPFLRGENDRGWKACFDWMLEPKNFTKLIEGNYDH